MVKTKGPAISGEASGSIAKTLTFARNNKRKSARAYAVPRKAPTMKQWFIRVMNKFLSSQWSALTAPEKLSWSMLAQERKLSPYHAYLSVNMKRWANNLAPGKAYPVSEAGAPPFNARPNCYGAYHHFKSKDLIRGAPNVWGYAYAYKLSTVIFTPGPDTIQKVIAHSFPPILLWWNLDLAPGQYQAYLRSFSPTGVWAPWTSNTTVWVTG